MKEKITENLKFLSVPKYRFRENKYKSTVPQSELLTHLYIVASPVLWNHVFVCIPLRSMSDKTHLRERSVKAEPEKRKFQKSDLRDATACATKRQAMYIYIKKFSTRDTVYLLWNYKFD